MIEIENVSFYYQGNEQMGAVNHLSLSIPKGQVVVLCGESGCGKTTVTRLMNGLIPNFYKGDLTGAVRVNGRDITKMPLYEIAENTGSVFQNPRSQFFNVDTDSELSFACENLGYPKDEIVARVRETVKDFKIERLLGKSLFHLSGGEKQTILNNIRFGKPTATLEEVRAAAKAARCDDFIMALPEGYDTLVQEGGNNLSGGEKQRISIARAILKDAPIIILDETTSALDTENEHEVLAAIEELTENKTVIMIAHRIKTVEKADHIIAIENGRIVQEGTHKELLHRTGIYADFIHAREKASGWKLGN